MKRLVLVTAVLFAVLPSSALASAVYIEPPDGDLFFEPDTGEVNDLQISESGGTVTVVDSGAVLTVGAGCNQVSIHEASCSGVGLGWFFLGDLNDSATVLQQDTPNGISMNVYGQGGEDQLTQCPACYGDLGGGGGADILQGGERGSLVIGGRGADTITGSNVRDDISGGPGNDTISSGGGNDFLEPGNGNDSVDGGAGGLDRVAFLARAPVGVTADLRTGIVTGGQGNDTLTHIECLTGSRHGDHFTGDSHDNCFNGQEGNDVINGRRGQDQIWGGDGDDRLHGGSGSDYVLGQQGDDIIGGGSGEDGLHGNQGNDRLRAKDGFADLVAGGRGLDRARVDGRDFVLRIETIFF